MTKRKFLKNLIIVLVLLLLFGAIVGFVVFIKNSDSDVANSNCHVEIGGKSIFTTATGYVVGIKEDNPLFVDVKSNNSDTVDYSVKIDADSSLRFSYVKDNKLCFFTSAEDVTSFFEIEETDTGFCVSSKGYSITYMLSCLNPDSTISFDDSIIDYKSTMFWITVSFNGDVNSFVKIGFAIKRYQHIISLDAKEIIF